MPKLSREQIEAAKSQGYETKSEELKPLPCSNGEAYVYKLVACTAGPSKSSGKLQWTWELTLDARYHPEYVGQGYLEKLWHYTPVEGGQEWAIAKMLHAFGYSPDTDTDELINDEATVLVYVTIDMYGTPPKPKMKARRFALHLPEEVPPAKTPLEEEAEAKMAVPAGSPSIPPQADPADDEF
jgi:hypothetical protein